MKRILIPLFILLSYFTYAQDVGVDSGILTVRGSLIINTSQYNYVKIVLDTISAPEGSIAIKGKDFYIRTTLANNVTLYWKLIAAGTGGTILDTSTRWSVDSTVNIPPVGTPTGSKVRVGASPIGVFIGHANEIATSDGVGNFTYQTADQGDLLSDVNTDLVDKFVGVIWVFTGKRTIHDGLDRYGKPINIGTGDNFALNLKTNNNTRLSILNNGVTRIWNLTGVAAGLVGASTNGTLSNIQLGTNLSITSGVLNATGSGTVSSVGLSTPSIFTVSGSPVTTSGTLGFNWTGISTGDILIATGANTVTRLGIGTTSQTLHVIGGIPAWRDTAIVGGAQGLQSVITFNPVLTTNNTITGTGLLWTHNTAQYNIIATDSIHLSASNDIGLFTLSTLRLYASNLIAKSANSSYMANTLNIIGYATSTSDSVVAEFKADGFRLTNIPTSSTTASIMRINSNGIVQKGTVNLTSEVNNTLPIGNGGTAATSFTAYAPIIGGTTSTNPLQSSGIGTSGQVYTSNGVGVAPSFQTFSTGVTSVTNTDGFITVSPTTGAVVLSGYLKKGAITGQSATTGVIQLITTTDSVFLGPNNEGSNASSKPLGKYVFAGGNFVSTSAGQTSFTVNGSSGAIFTVTNFNSGSYSAVINTNPATTTNMALFNSTMNTSSRSHYQYKVSLGSGITSVNNADLDGYIQIGDATTGTATLIEAVKGRVDMFGVGALTTVRAFSSLLTTGVNSSNNPATTVNNYYANLTYGGSGTGTITNYKAFQYDSIGYSAARVTNGYIWFATGTGMYSFDAGLRKFGYSSTGSTVPAALVHIGNGTSTIPGMKWDVSTLTATAVGGFSEYNNSFYQTKNSGLRYGMGGSIYDAYTDVNNSGTGETDIYSYTTPANTLELDGGKLSFNYTLSLSDITATAQIKVYFGGTAIANTGALTVSATGAVIVSGWIIRTSATTARCSVNISSPTASTAVYTSETDLTGLTLSSTNILKITAQAGGAGGGSNDITGKMATVSWQAVAAN